MRDRGRLEEATPIAIETFMRYSCRGFAVSDGSGKGIE
jgi:hypothetical protein